MTTDKIRFTHFFNKRALVPLQKQFVKLDNYIVPTSRNIVNYQEDLTIIVREDFVYNDEPNLKTTIEVEKKFEQDFLLPSINRMSKLYFENIRNLAENKGVYIKEGRESFIKKFVLKLQSEKELILQSDINNKDILDVVIAQIDELELLFEEFIVNPYPEIKRKIQFNWIRTDVEVFFHLLRESKVITHIGDADLGRIIDNMCECKVSLKSSEYTSIYNSRKHLNAFKNSEGRPDKDAIERLKGCLNADFFNK